MAIFRYYDGEKWIETTNLGGEPGPGVPEGGNDGDYLSKASNDDYDTEWVAITDKVSKSGDTMSGELILPGDPTQPLSAATKQYVESILSGNSALAEDIVVTDDDGNFNGNDVEAVLQEIAETHINHVNGVEPHPAYDDMANLTVIFENSII